jgi:hypothetical protein
MAEYAGRTVAICHESTVAALGGDVFADLDAGLGVLALVLGGIVVTVFALVHLEDRLEHDDQTGGLLRRIRTWWDGA